MTQAYSGKENPSSPNRSRTSSSDVLPLSYRRLVGAWPLNEVHVTNILQTARILFYSAAHLSVTECKCDSCLSRITHSFDSTGKYITVFYYLNGKIIFTYDLYCSHIRVTGFTNSEFHRVSTPVVVMFCLKRK